MFVVHNKGRHLSVSGDSDREEELLLLTYYPDSVVRNVQIH